MLIEETFKLRNLENLKITEKILLELNIDKLGLNIVILDKNFENVIIFSK